MGKVFSERQIGRLRYVGSNAVTGPVIEDSYVRFVDLMETHLKQHRFLLGDRPGAGDFGVFGQLTQLAHMDPTPSTLTEKRAPRVYAWVWTTDDLGGIEIADDGWFDPAALPATLLAILAETGRVYAPLLLANAAAVASGADSVETTIDGKPWSQQSFAYQAKCLGWLREEYAALGAGDRALVDGALAETAWAGVFG
jgi:hypothetical protein